MSKPDGSPLLILVPGAIPLRICEAARDSFRAAGRKFSGHRGFHTQPIGYYNDKDGCRKTEFTAKDVRRWVKVVPFIRACNEVFRRELPERFAAQQAAADRTPPEWVIADTCFTTTTVNLWDATHDARTSPHRDKGDLPAGFGVISVLRSGEYCGGELIFPQFGIAVDLQTTDVLLADVHEIHGNAAIVGKPGWERIAAISYFRTNMLSCPSKKF